MLNFSKQRSLYELQQIIQTYGLESSRSKTKTIVILGLFSVRSKLIVNNQLDEH